MKKILITGSSGYCGNYIMEELAKRYPDLEVVGMSRSGKSWNPEQMKQYKNVTYQKGDCCKPETFKDLI